ncbi:MAG: TlpA family protein disulfide reductase [Flavisolibacter sp.]
MRSSILIPVLLFLQPAFSQLNKQLNIGDACPDLKFANVYNHTGDLQLSDYSGKLIILDFFATNCVSCIAGFPRLEELQVKFGKD